MSSELITALQELEAAAAAVGHLLQDADEELLAQVAGAWAPLRPTGCRTDRWAAFWIAWLQDCADRVPVVPSQVDQGENWTCPVPLLRIHQRDGVMGETKGGTQNPVKRAR